MTVQRKYSLALRLLWPEDGVAEIRAPKAQLGRYTTTVSGYYDDPACASRDILRVDSHAPGVYITMNPCDRALLARSANRLNERAERTTTDADIVRRRWIIVDVDPTRPSGISATDGEKAAALGVAETIERDLVAAGWPHPVVADSGNGYHMLWRVDMPNDDAARDLIRAFLQALDRKYSTSSATVDISVFNAARIIKIPGTIAAKGDNIPERPHRVSSLVRVPDPVEIADPALMLDVVRQSPPVPPESIQPRTSMDIFDLRAWLDDHGVPYTISSRSTGGRTIYVLHQCPFNAAHGRDASVIQDQSGLITFHCFHAGCAHRTWPDLRAIHDGSYRDRKSQATQRQTAASAKTKSSDAEFEYMEHARYLAETYNIITFSDDDSIWIYEGGIYVQEGVPTIETYIARELNKGPEYCRHVMFRVRGLTRASRSAVNADPFLLHLQNCILDTRTMETREFSPAHVAIAKVPVEYDPDAIPVRFLRFLRDIFEDDDDLVTLTQEMFGYTLYPEYNVHKAFFLHGAGSNGKGVLLQLLDRLLGPQNTAHVSPGMVSGHNQAQYYRAELYGKLANIVLDMESRDIMDTSGLKSLVGNDPMMARKPYGQAFNFTNRAKFIFSMNHLPKLSDDTHGIWRRIILVPFHKIIPESKMDPNLLAKLETELPGILNWAIAGLARVMQRGGFHDSAHTRDTSERYERMADTIGSFRDDCLNIHHPSEYEDIMRYPKDTIYIAYRRYCAHHNITSPYTRVHFFRALSKSLGPQIRITRPEERVRVGGKFKIKRVQCIEGLTIYDPLAEVDVAPLDVEETFMTAYSGDAADKLLDDWGAEIDQMGEMALQRIEEAEK